ncbi:MAG TPA: hypothetical protein PKO06_15955 [Candidatus Ozemobacteraceae bacterium]|nr:hypothetical protein [Candidatus Ozemobacteraceae bacterium]
MTNDHRIRMGRADQPDSDQQQPREQGHTIVGGRPAGVTSRGGRIPRAMELMLKKAAVDQEFCRQLLQKRSAASTELGLELDPAERQMLDGIPEPQLKAIIAGTAVPDSQKRVLATGSAAAIVALLAQLSFSPVAARAEEQKQPSQTVTEVKQQVPGWSSLGEGGARADEPFDIMPPGGARPDMPDPIDIQPVRPPRPPAPPVQVAPTVPVDPAMQPGSVEFLKRAVVMSELNGSSFATGLPRLQSDLQAVITWKAPSEPDWARTIEATTAGASLDQALRDLARELYPGQDAEIDLQAGRVTIVVGTVGGAEFASPGAEAIKPQTMPSPLNPPPFDDDMNISRGIRPDFPDDMNISRGIRPDLPDLIPPDGKKRD